jgi:hypothetical protein
MMEQQYLQKNPNLRLVLIGILAQTAKINGENIVINSAGLASLACSYGGNYKFTHSTFNNNWNSSSQVAVSIDNFITGAVPEVKDLTSYFYNCIIYGSYSNELSIKKAATFAYQFNCLINMMLQPQIQITSSRPMPHTIQQLY